MRTVHHPNGLETWHFELGDESVLAAVTTRRGGRSSGAFDSLDLGFHVGDDPAAVAANRELVSEALGLGPLTVADQQHLRTVAVIDDELAGAGHGSLADATSRLPATDALVTDRSGVALAILVADCAPVVLYDPRVRALGVAHVGRSGAVVDVIGATVATMAATFGTRPADLLAGIGPCIGTDHYEIGGPQEAETRAAFGDDLLHDTTPGHARFDLLGAVRRRLDQAGVEPARVEALGIDTFRAEASLFSDRRERPCGRFALVASLRT